MTKSTRVKEILVEPLKPFSSQKILREVFADADRYIKIMDPWVSDRSFDPLLQVKESVSIHFLTSHTGCKEKERRLIRFMKNLQVEKPRFNLRKAKGEEIHDRWIITEEHVWSLSQSIKDFGRKETIALIAPHSKQVKKKVEKFFDSLWKKGIKIIT